MIQETGGKEAVSAKDGDLKMVGGKAGDTKAITSEQTENNLSTF